MKMTRTPFIDDIQLRKLCCCKALWVNWQNFAIHNDQQKEINIPKSASVSLFADRTLDNIEDKDPYSFMVLACELDMFFILRTNNHASCLQWWSAAFSLAITHILNRKQLQPILPPTYGQLSEQQANPSALL